MEDVQSQQEAVGEINEDPTSSTVMMPAKSSSKNNSTETQSEKIVKKTMLEELFSPKHGKNAMGYIEQSVSTKRLNSKTDSMPLRKTQFYFGTYGNASPPYIHPTRSGLQSVLFWHVIEML